MGLLKNLNNMITAEDLLHKNYFHIKTDLNKTNSYINIGDIYELMIEFARLHTKQALKEASENVEHLWDDNENELFDIDKDSILNAYPLENIK